MKERPILFSAPMVRALLAGTKTQTRRIVKPQQPKPTTVEPYDVELTERDGSITCYTRAQFAARCPYGTRGDRLWVKETFYCDDYQYPNGPREDLLRAMEYRADHDCNSWEAGCPCNDGEGHSAWRSPLHMPRWASRLTLEIISVRVQRLHEIAEEDARAEGCAVVDPSPHACARDVFSDLWRSINGAESWDANPWVWAVSFRRVDEP